MKHGGPGYRVFDRRGLGARVPSWVTAFATTAAVALGVLLGAPPPPARAAVASSWVGIGNTGEGNWGAANNWSPNGVPNNGNGGNTYDATVAWNPLGDAFNGPTLDVSVTLNNLTLINRAFVHESTSAAGVNLTVLGTTDLKTTPGHDGEYGVIFAGQNSTYLLGNLAQFDAATHTLNAGFLGANVNGNASSVSTLKFLNADVRTNNGVVFLQGPNANLLNQSNNADALANLSINNGTLQLVGGHNFTTAVNFTNNGGTQVGGFATANTTFTVTGQFTNYDAATHTLNGGTLNIDGSAGTSTFKFAGADVRTVNADLRLVGDAHLIDSSTGLDGLRNLSALGSSGTLSVSNTLSLNSAFVNNGGFVSVTGNGTVNMQAGFTGNGGTVRIGDDSGFAKLAIDGNPHVVNNTHIEFNSTPGTTSATLQASGTLTAGGGTVFLGTGTLLCDILAQDATFAPGHSPGRITVNGHLTLSDDTTLDMQLGGTTPGTGYDLIDQHSTTGAALAGTLVVTLIDGFEQTLSPSGTFAILTSDQALTGAFGNVASGGRLSTADGLGSFLVTYGAGSPTPNAVTLSNFIAAPEPTSLALVALPVLVGMRRRRTPRPRT